MNIMATERKVSDLNPKKKGSTLIEYKQSSGKNCNQKTGHL